MLDINNNPERPGDDTKEPREAQAVQTLEYFWNEQYYNQALDSNPMYNNILFFFTFVKTVSWTV
jgi:hypothetical protein